MLPHPLLTILLAALWVLLANSLAPGTLLLGLFLGWLIPLFTRRFWPDRLRVRHPLTLLAFCARVLYDMLVANFVVAWLILRGPRQLRPAFVTVPLALESDFALSVLANTICLTPGTLSAWLSPDRRTLIVHGLDVDDPEALISTIKGRYEAPLRRVFETC